ncbi:hypothetical protein CV_2683 [Chromobacterium violaceum ATCC 12472]|uniref:Uncharacterized protein n=1 Tax=Chromobacterium violaceum (strain ATCC 12472 / DSM 30191 / JCM 1249 / CCUG 213 / NBRC 12614 / NCIMB 9131 / NCTC 9757 / MK) TaxID=243365 RepID=Q7NUL4_CHRVO|nr:hypothetical protein CV_2683 [Chromobacterium violaceum ATCC 12472]
MDLRRLQSCEGGGSGFDGFVRPLRTCRHGNEWRIDADKAQSRGAGETMEAVLIV